MHRMSISIICLLKKIHNILRFYISEYTHIIMYAIVYSNNYTNKNYKISKTFFTHINDKNYFYFIINLYFIELLEI